MPRSLLQIRRTGRQLADFGKGHSSEAFFGCDNPLESVIFSTLPEIRNVQDGMVNDVDP
ncbi:MAG TPA: hypothetical protein P5013_00100 [Methanoregula sp.]|nr:hypothetical protein [Methanoregula sp.]